MLFRNIFYIKVGLVDEWISILVTFQTSAFLPENLKFYLECKVNIFTIYLKVAG